jgi:NAD(P)-dependent dehydrogenase (short-subunit alcohol dehydrogenase family)
MDLTNVSAIVTGGAGGFGSAIVRRLAQKGAKVVIADVPDERGEALAREVGAGSLYVHRLHGEDAIATAVKAAAGLGPTSVRHRQTRVASARPCMARGRSRERAFAELTPGG